MSHKVLVAYASRHGSTGEIAERIAASLRANDMDATVLPMDRVKDAEGYDAYVLGSAIYAMRWLGEARSFVRRHRATLLTHPVWLFSSGPLGEEPTDAAEAREVTRLAEEINARAHVTFAGAWDAGAKPIGVLEHVMHAMPAARNALPSGDFRDWDAIDGWARSIAGELDLALATS